MFHSSQSSQSELLESCYRYDVRLSPESSPTCRSYNSANIGSLPDDMQMAFLLQQSLAHSLDDEFNILITSNIVPMWKSFVDGKKFCQNDGNKNNNIGSMYDNILSKAGF